MKKTFALTLMCLAFLSFASQTGEPLTGNEILTVQKNSMPNKICKQHKPHINVVAYHTGK